MSDRTSIQWSDATWNPTRGCSKVSEGCRGCYAMRFAARFSGPGQPYEGLARMTPRGPEWTGAVRFIEDALTLPLKWKRPRRVFVDSMSDLFHEKLVLSPSPGESRVLLARIFAVMMLTRQHTFQVLTKRPHLMAAALNDRTFLRTVGDEAAELARRLPAAWGMTLPEWPLRNIWLGTSVEDQAAAEERIPHLLKTPAAVRFLSCEPLLGPLDLSPWLDPLFGGTTDDGEGPPERYASPIQWCIIGGESGPAARPMDLAWARSLIKQCRDAGVAVFVKQLGAHPHDYHGPDARPRCRAPRHGRRTCSDGDWQQSAVLKDAHGGDPAEWPKDLRVREYPKEVT